MDGLQQKQGPTARYPYAYAKVRFPWKFQGVCAETRASKSGRPDPPAWSQITPPAPQPCLSCPGGGKELPDCSAPPDRRDQFSAGLRTAPLLPDSCVAGNRRFPTRAADRALAEIGLLPVADRPVPRRNDPHASPPAP